MLPFSMLQSQVTCFRKTRIFPEPVKLHPGKGRFEMITAAVGRMIVNNDHFHCNTPSCPVYGVEALFQEIFYIIVNNNYRKHNVLDWINELRSFKGVRKILCVSRIFRQTHDLNFCPGKCMLS